MKNYLSISLLHPEVVRGGSQKVAFEVFKAARAEADVTAHFLAGVDPVIENVNCPPGAVFTGLADTVHENLMMSYGFDTRFHTQTSWFVVEKMKEYFSSRKWDWIHFHHSLFVGLEMLDIVKELQPQAKIFYTLHEYLPICHADGQLRKTGNRGLCYSPNPQACFKCFPEQSVDFFFLREQMFKSHFDLVDHFITPSDFTRQRFIDWGIDASRITTIPNGQENLNTGSMAPPATPRSEANFAFFGQMIDNKGAHLILEAASLLAEAYQKDSDGKKKKKAERLPFKINLFGGNLNFASEAYRNKIETLLEEAAPEVRAAIQFHGEYSHDQLPALMNRVDCVITPSTWFEVFGLVVSEAWMFGKPVIAADIGGLSERIQPGGNGLKFQADDANDLAEKMREYITDYHFGDKSFDTIEPPLSREAFWQAHRRVFEQVEAGQTEIDAFPDMAAE